METELDRAYRAMEADDTARPAFYDRLVSGALFAMLGEEGAPRVFDLDEGRYVLAFDTEERLADFAAGPTDYAAMPGRRLVAALARQGIGLALNLGGAPSQMLLPAEAVDWLAQRAAAEPQPEAEARLTEIRTPGPLPEALIQALDLLLRQASGLAERAYLCRAGDGSGPLRPLLAVIGAAPEAERALARAVQEAAAFADASAPLDIAFFVAGHPATERLDRVGLRIDLPAPAPERPAPDPTKPPRLR